MQITVISLFFADEIMKEQRDELLEDNKKENDAGYWIANDKSYS